MYDTPAMMPLAWANWLVEEPPVSAIGTADRYHQAAIDLSKTDSDIAPYHGVSRVKATARQQPTSILQCSRIRLFSTSIKKF
jgi:hypothetical protein